MNIFCGFRVPNLTSSLTVIRILLGRFEAACGTHPILPLSEFEKLSFPYTRTMPPVLWTVSRSPRMVRRSVVLPLPFGPTNPTNSPFLISRSTSWITISPERATDRSLICRRGAVDSTPFAEPSAIRASLLEALERMALKRDLLNPPSNLGQFSDPRGSSSSTKDNHRHYR